jgi:hypothetical protein
MRGIEFFSRWREPRMSGRAPRWEFGAGVREKNQDAGGGRTFSDALAVYILGPRPDETPSPIGTGHGNAKLDRAALNPLRRR